MKIYMKPIEVIAWYKIDDFPIPIRIRVENDDESKSVITVDKVIEKEVEKIVGNKMIVYKCQAVFNDTLRHLELKYEINTGKWFLYKL